MVALSMTERLVRLLYFGAWYWVFLCGVFTGIEHENAGYFLGFAFGVAALLLTSRLWSHGALSLVLPVVASCTYVLFWSSLGLYNVIFYTMLAVSALLLLALALFTVALVVIVVKHWDTLSE